MSEFPYTDPTEQCRLPHAEIVGCVLVQDLIPLYLDGEVSPESHVLIAEHVAHCERCSGYLAGARTVRSQILHEQQKIRAARVGSQTVEQVRQPVARSFGAVLWQSLMGLLYLGALLVMFVGFSEGAVDALLVSGMMLAGAVTGSLLAGSTSTKSWRALMVLSIGAGALLGVVSLADMTQNAEVFAFYSLGVVMLGMWGMWLHTKQRPQLSPATQPLGKGAEHAMLMALLNVVGALICGIIIVTSVTFMVEGLSRGLVDITMIGGVLFVLSSAGLLVINHQRGWVSLPHHFKNRQHLLGFALLFLGVLSLLATFPTAAIFGVAWLVPTLGVGLTFVGLRLLQQGTSSKQ